MTRRLSALPRFREPGDKVLFLRILGFALSVPVLLRLGLPKLASLLEPKAASWQPEPAKVRQIVSYVDAVMQLGKPLVRPGCLTRSLTRYYFLRQAGFDVSVIFGMGEVDDEFAGHCWLTRDGEPFMETKDPRPQFQVVHSFPKQNRSAVNSTMLIK